MAGDAAKADDAPAKSGKRRMLLIGGGAVVLLGGGGAGAAFFLGLPPFASHGVKGDAPHAPIFVEVPDIVANLNTGGRRQTFVRLRSKLELSRAQDTTLVQSSMPRLLDMFTTYLRETRPEELRGSAGAHRLREELVARANIATRAGAVTDVLFVELVVQ